MNKTSLAHTHVQNQQKPSWNDDPFDLGYVTGVTPLSHQSNLDDYALEMVASFGKFKDDQYDLTIDMLSTPYQLEFARLYIESIDREIEWACYGDDQSLNSDFLCALLAMLKDSTEETRTNFAQVTTRNILIYYKETFNNLLDIACDVYYHNQMNEAGYRAETDYDNGDVVWIR